MLGRPLHVTALRALCLVTLVLLSFAIGRWLRDPTLGRALLIVIAGAWLGASSWWLLRPGGLAGPAPEPATTHESPAAAPAPRAAEPAAALAPRAAEPAAALAPRAAQPATTPAPRAAEPAGLDLNTATEAQLVQLRGIGPVAAARILADRDSNGPFAALDDLARVPGFGAARIEQLAAQGVHA